MPVYRVVETGISEGQARKLGEVFRIPAEQLHWRDGHVSFVDRHKYLAVPSVAIDQPETVERFTNATTNHHPEIPIALHGIDYAALERHQPLAPEVALKTAAEALDAADLTPALARPIVGHTMFTTVSVDDDGEEKERRKTPLDTHVSHRFTLDGYPLIGPGAQVQLSFASDGEVTRVLHSTRTLEPGPSVAILDEKTIRQRVACSLPDEAEVTVELVYYSPGLRNELNASAYWRPTELIPYYAVRVTRQLVHPGRGTAHPLTSRIRLVPAIEDARFVPSVSLEATTREGSRVEARAAATGGTPPYTFLWGGSNADASHERGDRVSYEPITRDLREIIPSHSLTRSEHLSVTVVDANGVTAAATTSLPVTARPARNTHNSVSYGCESPDDPGAWTGDRIAWRNAMSSLGGGSERFCWMGDDSWPGDYIEPSPAGGPEPNPWINGDADYQNWGINTANIVFYIGDSNPYGFVEMFPGAPPSAYNTSAGATLFAPDNTTTVAIGSQSYNVPYAGAWGSPHPGDKLQWMGMYACNLLESDDSTSPPPWQRWGPAFNGLHSLLAFQTEAQDSNDFCFDWPLGFLGLSLPFLEIEPTTIVQAWISAARGTSIGTPAAMGPIFNIDIDGLHLGLSDYGDYYWGRGWVGPTIPRSLINGWWYIQG